MEERMPGVSSASDFFLSNTHPIRKRSYWQADRIIFTTKLSKAKTDALQQIDITRIVAQVTPFWLNSEKDHFGVSLFVTPLKPRESFVAHTQSVVNQRDICWSEGESAGFVGISRVGSCPVRLNRCRSAAKRESRRSGS